MEVTHIREENKKLTKTISDLRGKLADLEARVNLKLPSSLYKLRLKDISLFILVLNKIKIIMLEASFMTSLNMSL